MHLLGAKASSSFCHVHALGTGRPHCNSECQQQQVDKAKQQQQQQRRQAAPPYQGAAGQQAGSGSGSSSGAGLDMAQLSMLIGGMVQQHMHSSSVAGDYHAAAGQGLPWQTPKATEPNRGKQQQQRAAGAPQQAAPCRHCGYASGHDPRDCWIESPNRVLSSSTPHWGPPFHTAPEVLKHYIRCCQEVGMLPRLDRVRARAADLLQGNQLTPQQQQLVREALSKGLQQAAAGQIYGQPPQPSAPLLHAAAWQAPALLPAAQQPDWQQPYTVQPPPSSDGGSACGQQAGFDSFRFYGCAAQTREGSAPPPVERAAWLQAA